MIQQEHPGTSVMKTKENTISPREEEEWSATVFQSDNLSKQSNR